MKNFVLCCAVLFLSVSVLYAQTASKTSVLNVDGMSVFGYDSTNKVYIYIGSIASKYYSDSIANEYGWGSKYKSDSIMNEYGRFGSKYSSYSAFNTFATTPPIIINANNQFVCYLTVNILKIPFINTNTAIDYANNSFNSPIQAHKDMVIIIINIPESMGIDEDTLPEHFKLIGNYPNPFNSATSICFTLPELSKTLIRIYSISGQYIDTLIDEVLVAGYHSVQWNPRNLSTGIYVYTLETESGCINGKMLFVK